jgi:hypothetical protein
MLLRLGLTSGKGSDPLQTNLSRLPLVNPGPTLEKIQKEKRKKTLLQN